VEPRHGLRHRPKSRRALRGHSRPTPHPPSFPQTALGDTWEQFEQGVTVGPAGPSAIVQSITATDGAIEGLPVSIGVTLSGTPSAGSTVTLSLTEANGVTLLTQEFEADELFINPMFLSQGTYIASATLGGSSKNATFQVIALQPPTPVLMSLTANPTSVQSGSPFTLTADISGATLADDITIPLRLAIGGVPKVPQIWLGEQLAITAGATSGDVTIRETLQPGIYTWTATYGGATGFSATVQVT